MNKVAKITVHKLEASGKEKIAYNGTVICRTPEKIILQAYFTQPDGEVNGILFKKGDLFYEAYYRERWYNIDEIYDRDDGRLKCWYCNIAMPPNFTRWSITYVDLALDLLVYPDGSQKILDKDELAALHLPAQKVKHIWDTLAELQDIFKKPADFRLRRDRVVRQFRA